MLKNQVEICYNQPVPAILDAIEQTVCYNWNAERCMKEYILNCQRKRGVLWNHGKRDYQRMRKAKFLSAIRNSNRISLSEDCGGIIVIYFME